MEQHSFSDERLVADRIASHRMLDANGNRLHEALRTLEDIARFRDLPALQQAYKQARHEAQGLTKSWDALLMLNMRDSMGDVGREVKTDAEGIRAGGLSDIAAAASSRAQQALRCIEEICKFAYPNTASDWEKLRYRLYDWNAKTQLSLNRDHAFLLHAKLYVLVDCQLPPKEFSDRISKIAKGGAAIIQIRDKRKEARDLVEYTQLAIDSVDPQQTRIIVNDRADVARSTHCFGLHVGQTDLSIAQCRLVLRPETVVGLSTHDSVQVDQAVAWGADYIGCGPTFPSSTKSFTQFSGLAFLEGVSTKLTDAKMPAFAIGGITAENISWVRKAGFHRVAVSSSVWHAADPGSAAKQLRDLLE